MIFLGKCCFSSLRKWLVLSGTYSLRFREMEICLPLLMLLIFIDMGMLFYVQGRCAPPVLFAVHTNYNILASRVGGREPTGLFWSAGNFWVSLTGRKGEKGGQSNNLQINITDK